MFENDIDYILSTSARDPYNTITIYDKELITDELKERMEFLTNNQNRSFMDRYVNKRSNLEPFSRSVNDMFKAFSSRFRVESFDQRPNITGDLPINEIELEEYIRWMTEVYQMIRGERFEGLIDYYGTPLKYEITPEGLKIISAGRDKILETEDDEYILREYKDYNMN